MSQDKTYNGWANYATWRINLEIFDGMDFTGFSNDVSILADQLKDYANEIVFMDIPKDRMCSLVSDYAGAFLDEVNWYEIAKNIIQEQE